MRIHEVIKEACGTAVAIVVAAFIMSYVINLGNVASALSELPLWVVIVALLSIGGRVLGAVAGVTGAMRASIVSPEVAGYARGATRTASEELSSWAGHLLGMALSFALAHVVKYAAFLFLSH